MTALGTAKQRPRAIQRSVAGVLCVLSAMTATPVSASEMTPPASTSGPMAARESDLYFANTDRQGQAQWAVERSAGSRVVGLRGTFGAPESESCFSGEVRRGRIIGKAGFEWGGHWNYFELKMDGRGGGSAFRIVATYEDQNQTRVTGWRKVSLPTLSSMEQGWLSGDSDWNWVLDRCATM